MQNRVSDGADRAPKRAACMHRPKDSAASVVARGDSLAHDDNFGRIAGFNTLVYAPTEARKALQPAAAATTFELANPTSPEIASCNGACYSHAFF
jgi:hypothetical protein